MGKNYSLGIVLVSTNGNLSNSVFTNNTEEKKLITTKQDFTLDMNGTIEGSVNRIGVLPCPPTVNFSTFCQGPIRGYPIEVQNKMNTSFVEVIRTGSNGRFNLSLPTGEYTIQNEFSNDLLGSVLVSEGNRSRVNIGAPSSIR